jgi:cyclophilin family peptidyl-prolyl cis-trans isomerase
MNRVFLMVGLLLMLAPPVLAVETVEIKTNVGTIRLELDDAKAPLTVKNFLQYVDAGFYNGTIFHRVIKGFMIQGGGLNAGLQPKSTNPPIKNEANNGLQNLRGTIAMARTGVVDSATSQFFINTADNRMLDHKVRDYGYAVFGKVVAGMDVVDKIENGATGMRNGFRDVPVETVTIESVRRVKK